MTGPHRLLALWLAGLALGAPAAHLRSPRPEPCIAFDADPDEGEMISPSGLDYEQVTAALNAVLQTALECPLPPGPGDIHLTFELVVGCDGVVSSIEATDIVGASEDYAACVLAVIAKADFPAHDMADGMPITYPVNVAWE